MHYFGPWDDPDGSSWLKKYLAEKDDLHAGRKPRPDSEAVTVRDVCNSFLNHKRDLRDNGELSPRTWAQYKETCDQLVEHLGKRRLVSDLGPDDFRKRYAANSPSVGNLAPWEILSSVSASCSKYAPLTTT